MPKIKSLNGYEITDEYARAQIENIQGALSNQGSGDYKVTIDEDGDLWFGSTEEIEQLLLPVAVDNGGTGATTLEGAKENLGIADLETQVDDISAQLEDKVHKEIDFAISWSDGIWLTDAKMETLKSAKGIKFNTNGDDVFCGTLQPISISSSRVEFMCSGYLRGVLIPTSYLIVFDRLVESTTADSWNLRNVYYFDWTSLNLSQEEASTVASITKIIIQ